MENGGLCPKVGRTLGRWPTQGLCRKESEESRLFKRKTTTQTTAQNGDPFSIKKKILLGKYLVFLESIESQ